MKQIKALAAIALISLLLVSISGCTSPNGGASPSPTPNASASAATGSPPALTTPTLSVTPTPSRIVLINSPSNNSLVSQSITVQGSAKRIPGDQILWILVVPQSVGRYYPVEESIPIKPDGTWSHMAGVGSADPGDVGQKFDIIAVLANSSADAAFRNYVSVGVATQNLPGMTILPSGASIQDKITVTRT